MNAPTRRRWFVFSLRTVFVTTLAISIPLGWVAWQSRIVRHRQAMLVQLEESKAVVSRRSLFQDAWDFSWIHALEVRTIKARDDNFKMPLIRSWFGDRPINFIGFNRELTAADRQAIAAFPEAMVEAMP